MRSLHSRAGRLLAGVVTLGLLTGCIQMPTSGDVNDADLSPADSQAQGISIDPLPPQAGASRNGIVEGFFDAMLATPVQTNSASQFLTPQARDRWNPSAEIITFTERTPATGSDRVSVTLGEPMHLDDHGAWQGALTPRRKTIEFPVTKVDGEWRISKAPDALIVPQSWFASRYTQVALYFFDPTGQFLVPEPVFVPRGSQLATAVVRGLVRGPGNRRAPVTRSFMPADVTEGLSVPVTDGVADIQFGGAEQTMPESVDLMIAQLASTLRQVAGVQAFRVFVGGRPLSDASRSEWSVSEGAEYDASAVPVDARLFGLSRGGLVAGAVDDLQPVAGAVGVEGAGLRSFAVSSVEDRVAVVGSDGTSLSLGQMRRSAGLDPVMTGARDLTQPVWDRINRLWIADRTRSGARIWWLYGSIPRTVPVRGISGANVRKILISPDGTRLVALVRRQSGDAVMVSRVVAEEGGRIVRVTRARAITDRESVGRISDISWSSPTAVLVLQQLADTSLVRSASVDGAESGFAAISVTISGQVRDVVSASWPATVWALTRNRIVAVTPQAQDRALPIPLDRLQYAD